MPKTQEELNQLKQEFEQLSEKLKELTDDELKQITGGKTYACTETNCPWDPENCPRRRTRGPSYDCPKK